MLKHNLHPSFDRTLDATKSDGAKSLRKIEIATQWELRTPLGVANTNSLVNNLWVANALWIAKTLWVANTILLANPGQIALAIQKFIAEEFTA